MKRWLFYMLIVFAIFLHGACFAFQDNDFQYWNTEGIDWKVAKDWKLAAEEEFRFGDDAGDFYYQHSDFGLTYSGLADWFDIGVNYRLVFEEINDDWKYENRPHINGTVKFDVEGFEISDRNRFEYRDKEDGNDGWRYRNKATLKLPLKLTKWQIRPYVANEIFVDFDKEEYNKNRFYSGISFKPWKYLKGDIFYLWQSSKSKGKWTNYHILGTKLKLSF